MPVPVAVMIMVDDRAVMLALVMAMVNPHVMLAARMAAGLLRLSRRRIAIAPAGLPAVLHTTLMELMAVTIMVAVAIMTHMNPMIAVMVPVAIVPFIVVIFGEQRSAQHNGENQQKT